MALKHTIAECPQVERLALLERASEKHDHTLDGNGQEGVVKKVVRLEEKVDKLNETVNDIKENQDELFTKISQVLDYKVGQEAIYKDRAVRKVHLKWLIGTVITLSLGIGGLIINMKSENNKLKEANQTILNNANEDRSKDYIPR